MPRRATTTFFIGAGRTFGFPPAVGLIYYDDPSGEKRQRALDGGGAWASAGGRCLGGAAALPFVAPDIAFATFFRQNTPVGDLAALPFAPEPRNRTGTTGGQRRRDLRKRVSVGNGPARDITRTVPNSVIGEDFTLSPSLGRSL